MNKYLMILSLLVVSACNSLENRNIDLESAKNSPLVVPPCLNK